MSGKLDYYFNSAMKEHTSLSEGVAKVILKAMTSEDPKLIYTANDDDDDDANSDPWYYKQETACQIEFQKIIMQNF